MATRTIDRRFQVRRADQATWLSKDHVLLEGEIGFEINTNRIKIGNGINSWTNLPYLSGGGGGSSNTVDSYRSSYEVDGYVYSGMLLNAAPYIIRTIDNTTETAQVLSNLENDWTNRLNLTYI